jgi:hypothetical protein
MGNDNMAPTPTITASADEIRNIDNFCAAKNTGADNYEGLCAKCGWTEFSTDRRKCVSCFDRRGASRINDGPRATARRAGDDRYIDQCETHGRAYFGVRYGKCLECFTTEGRKRAVRPSYVIEEECSSGELTALQPG